MYSFPNMRRNSSYKDFIDIGIFSSFLLVYDALSSMYLFLPPLFGILFLSFVNFFEKERYYSLVCFVLVLFIMESSKGFYPGILLVVYSLVYIFVFNRIVKMFKYVNLFEILYVPIVYCGFMLIHSFVGINDNAVIFTPMILLYVFLETLILVGRWILDIK